MKLHKKQLGSTLSLLLTLSILLSMLVLSVIAKAPAEGATLALDDTLLTLDRGEETFAATLKVPVSQEQKNWADNQWKDWADSIQWSLTRDKADVQNPEYYPNIYTDDDLESWMSWSHINQHGADGEPYFSLEEPEFSIRDGSVTVVQQFSHGIFLNIKGETLLLVTNSLQAIGSNTFRYACNVWPSFIGNYELAARVDGEKLAGAPMEISVYESNVRYDELYHELTEIKGLAEAKGRYFDVQPFGKSTDGRDQWYTVVSDNAESVESFKGTNAQTQPDPEAVLEAIEGGMDYRMPIMMNNCRPDETGGVDIHINLLRTLATEDTMTRNTITGLTGGKRVDMGVYDPKVMGFALESGDGGTEYAFTGHGLKISTTTIDGSGNDGRTGANEYYTFSEDKRMNVDEILDNLIIIVVPDENPDGRTYNTCPSGNSFDLNRDASNQTQAETSNIARLICQWNPVAFIEFHGFTAQFLCEPCTSPHESNLEYDLFVEQFLLGAEAFGNVALVTMSVQHEDGFETKYQTYYTPLRDSYDAKTDWDARDDLSTNYAPNYAMLDYGSVGFTIETPSGGGSSVRLLESGIYGLWQFLSDCKDTRYEAQLEFFRRAVNNEDRRDKMGQWYVDMSNQTLTKDTRRVPHTDNGKYFLEYYVLPVDVAAQRNPADAYAMAEFLIRNGAQISRLTRDTAVDGMTYKAGSLIVDMYQAKRNYANCVLNQGYDASASGFPNLCSESVSSFPNMRGSDCAPIDTVGTLEGVLEAVTEVQSASQSTGSGSIALLANNGTEAVRAINALLASGKTVGMVIGGTNKGDFVMRASDLVAVEQEYALAITLTEQMSAARAISAPTLYLAGCHTAFGDDKVTSGYYTKWFTDGYGFINYDNIHNNGTSSYDVVAYTKHMGFRVADDPAKADIVVGSVTLDSDAWGEAAMEAVKSGTPYIATGAPTLDYLQTPISGLTYEGKGQEALHCVTYPSDSLVTASQAGDGDHVTYILSCAVLTGYPENAEVLIRAQEKDSFIAGRMAGGSMDNGVEAIAWTGGTMDITVFANSIVNRAHQQDNYPFASNAIFSEILADEPLEFFAVTRGTLAQELYEREGKPTGGATGSDDMAEDAACADAVNWAASEGIMEGYSAAAFGPGDSLTREQLAVILYRYAQKRGYELAQDGPVLKDFTGGNAMSDWALEAMTWAVNTGVLIGKEDGTLAPQGAAIADEVTQALERLTAAAG